MVPFTVVLAQYEMYVKEHVIEPRDHMGVVVQRILPPLIAVKTTRVIHMYVRK